MAESIARLDEAEDRRHAKRKVADKKYYEKKKARRLEDEARRLEDEAASG